MRFGDVSGDNPSPESKDRILHATLHIGPGVIIVIDTMPGTPAAKGSDTEVCLHLGDIAERTKVFDALAVGGDVTRPPLETFWGLPHARPAPCVPTRTPPLASWHGARIPTASKDVAGGPRGGDL
ncbi:VOC family protein [Sorangium atrum]|uniref:Uncharacterized protein n=1 Tax=Sorangium atrum TaxID=2995308 RepID=A0ABT5C2Y7_9BACT|nr:hypothetical protein [Sorangium aterium]MDC0680129.1 hypothetical protein [Sorangium aterium]